MGWEERVRKSRGWLADFAVEFVDKLNVDPRYLEPVFVAEWSTTAVFHLSPVDADLHVDFRSISIHAVHQSFVERLNKDRTRLAPVTPLQ